MNQTSISTTAAGELFFQKATPAQRQQIITLLAANKLPVHDLSAAVVLYALTEQGRLIGTAGLEVWGNKALLRSVSIADDAKGRGLGRFVGQQIERIAIAEGIDTLYLLTTTAESFFGKLGYVNVKREEVPQELGQSGQFNGVCPASAAIMCKSLL